MFLLIITAGLTASFSVFAVEEAASEELTAESLTKANAALEETYDKGNGKVEEKVNVAVDANSEAGKALQAAKGKTADVIAANPAWSGLEPQIEVGKWGQEIRIIVKPSGKMKSESLLAIKSVKLETVKGEFLGLKTYAADEKSRDAEFMVNPEILKIDSVKVTVSSGVIGEYATLASLTPSEPAVKADEVVAAKLPEQAAAAAVEAVETVEAKAETPVQEQPKKKKGWW